jgi:hypothetical protein
VRRALIALGAIVIVALALNVAGIIRYPGGPLREPSADGILWLDIRPADQGGITNGNGPDADWARTDTDLVFTSLWVSNPSPWSVTVEAITPIDVSGELVVGEVFASRRPQAEEQLVQYGPLTAEGRAVLGRDYSPLPAAIDPGDSNRNLALVVRSSRPGAAGFEALAIDYRLGPFAFRVVHHMALHACLGMTVEERVCPGYD